MLTYEMTWSSILLVAVSSIGGRGLGNDELDAPVQHVADEVVGKHRARAGRRDHRPHGLAPHPAVTRDPVDVVRYGPEASCWCTRSIRRPPDSATGKKLGGTPTSSGT